MKLVPQPIGWSPRAGGSFRSQPFAPAFVSAPVRRPSMGETEQTWYARAKAAVVQHDALTTRAAKVSFARAREELFSAFVGDPQDPESALYRRNSVANNLSEAESFTPINYMVFATDRARNRVEKLEEWNRQFEDAVSRAENTYGVNPEPIHVERVVTREASRDYTVPALLVAGILLASFAVSYLLD